MRVVSTIKEVREQIMEWKQQGYEVGLVPTMGYLHEGHKSLIERAVKENDKVVVSIFVNPMQFGPNEDLDTYPRDLERDAALCSDVGADLIFNPESSEMYKDDFCSFVDINGLSDGLCGKSRPIHFRGVCTVVSKLFNIVTPHRAYFGEKDAQQLAIIKRIVRDLNFNIEIVGCPIIREKDGLARSSRNTYLSIEERTAATILNKSLTKAKELLYSGERNSKEILALIKETIESETIGYGHFEPLRHYAEVHLKLLPGERGEGIVFENRCHNDYLTPGQQNLIKTHIFEKKHRGILTGSEIDDIKVILITGRAHIKHTEGGDFREATKRALRQGLDSAENILLEPYYNFKIEVDNQLLGRVLSDVQKMNGTFNEQQSVGDRVIITGRGPVATFMDYSLEFQALSKGKGGLSLMYGGYDVCHNAEEVIERIGYNKDADPEYTSSSIFCAKGVGYSVKGDEVVNYMHCLKK